MRNGVCISFKIKYNRYKNANQLFGSIGIVITNIILLQIIIPIIFFTNLNLLYF